MQRLFMISERRLLMFCLLFFLSGCRGILGIPDPASESGGAGMSGNMRAGLHHLSQMPYAMLYGRFSDQEEMAFILAEQARHTMLDHWVGSGGVELWLEGSVIRATRGLGQNLLRVEIIDEGGVDAFLRQKTEKIEREHLSIQWAWLEGQPHWVECVGRIESIVVVPYNSFAFNGRAWQVTERVAITGEGEVFERVYWIEPVTRVLLRMKTRSFTTKESVVLEWVRVPDRKDMF